MVMRSAVALPVVILLLATLVAVFGGSDPTSSVALREVSLPPGKYTVQLVWGDVIAEDKITVSEKPLDITMKITRINIRKPLYLTITGENEVLVEVVLIPSPFGYQVQKLYVDPRVKVLDTRATMVIVETVTVTNVTVSWISSQSVKFKDIKVNGLRPPEVEFYEGKVVVPNLVVDSELGVHVIFEEGSIEASFVVGAAGLMAFSRFEGPFSRAFVNYTYGVKSVSWVVTFPLTREANSTILLKDAGYIEAGRSASSKIHVEEVRSVTTEMRREEEKDNRDLITIFREYVARLRTELAIMSGILLLAGFIRRRLTLIFAGMIMALIVLIGVVL